ncbi:MAG: hypothetical protein JJD98_14175 [Polaromonas sp.]|nr:hypothetical protein [Polaromonas sp.]
MFCAALYPLYPLQKFDSDTERRFAVILERDADKWFKLAKARNELGADDVKVKAEAGALWCRHASDHARTTGAKPWKYLLISHDVVTEDKQGTKLSALDQIGVS